MPTCSEACRKEINKIFYWIVLYCVDMNVQRLESEEFCPINSPRIPGISSNSEEIMT